MNHQVYGLLLLQRRQVAECVVGVWGVFARRLSVVVYAGGPAYNKGGWGLERSCSGPHPLYGVLWRCPTLPHPPRCSTIGACGLSFQVRNGGWAFPRGYDHHKMVQPVFTCPPRVSVSGVVLVVIRIVATSILRCLSTPFTVSVCG